MRRYLAYLLVLIIAVCLGLFVASDPGTADFSYHHYTVEMPLWLVAVGIIIAFTIAILLLRLVDNTRFLLQRTAYWKNKRKLMRLQKNSQRGMLELFEGRFAEAEKHLQQSSEYTDTPLIDYLSAAQAANAVGAYDRRDEYLNKAKNKNKQAETAILIIKARCQLAEQQLDAAAQTLKRLYKKQRRHPVVLNLLRELYDKQHNWPALLNLLPSIEKMKILDDEEIEQLYEETYIHLLQTSAEPEQTFKQMPRRFRRNSNIVEAYVLRLIEINDYNRAQKVIEKILKKHWDDRLCHHYAELKTKQTSQQFKVAEKWLQQHPENPVLLATLGKLALQLQLWGKAKTYLRNSLSIRPHPQTYRALAKLLEEQGNSKEALHYYRDALDLLL